MRQVGTVGAGVGRRGTGVGGGECAPTRGALCGVLGGGVLGFPEAPFGGEGETGKLPCDAPEEGKGQSLVQFGQVGGTSRPHTL